jgi:hypothetical protein
LREGLGDLYDAVSVSWYYAPSGRHALWADWAADNFHGAQENSAQVWITPADTMIAEQIGALLRSDVLPELAEWLPSHLTKTTSGNRSLTPRIGLSAKTARPAGTTTSRCGITVIADSECPARMSA